MNDLIDGNMRRSKIGIKIKHHINKNNAKNNQSDV